MPNSDELMVTEWLTQRGFMLKPVPSHWVSLMAGYARLVRAEARREAIEECAFSLKAVGIEDLKAAGLGYVIAKDASAVLAFAEKRLRSKLAAPEKEETNV